MLVTGWLWPHMFSIFLFSSVNLKARDVTVPLEKHEIMANHMIAKSLQIMCIVFNVLFLTGLINSTVIPNPKDFIGLYLPVWCNSPESYLFTILLGKKPY